MSVNVEISGMGRILTESEFSNYTAQKVGDPPAEGQYDLRKKKYNVYAIETELLVELKEMMENVADELDCEFNEDGELEQYHEDETLDKLLRKFLYVERQPLTYNVTVEFTVEAFSQEEAETKVTDELGWGLDYNVTSVYED